MRFVTESLSTKKTVTPVQKIDDRPNVETNGSVRRSSLCVSSQLYILILSVTVVVGSIALATLLVSFFVKSKSPTMTSITIIQGEFFEYRMESNYSFYLAMRIFWSFDDTLNDLYDVYNGIQTGTSTFSSPGYNGAGTCLWLTRSLGQYVNISSPFLNITRRSFSFSAWVYPRTTIASSDVSIISQFHRANKSLYLHIVIRHGLAYLGFYDNDTRGQQVGPR